MEFDDLWYELKRQAQSKRDPIVRANKIFVEPVEKEDSPTGLPDVLMDVPPVKLEDGTREELGVMPLTHNAKVHLFGRLEPAVPTRFALALLSKGHVKLVAHMLNTLLQDYAERNKGAGNTRKSTALLVRTVEDKEQQRWVRNIGTQYTDITLDNHNVVDATLLEMKKHGLTGENIHRCDLSGLGDKLYMTVLKPNLVGTIKARGQIVEGGFILENSDTGLSSLRFDKFARIVQCDNGMIGDVSWRKIHRGSKLDEDIASNRTRTLEGLTLLSYVQDLIKKTFNEDDWSKWVNRMNDAVEIEVEDENLAVENLSAKFLFPEEVEKDLLKTFLKEPGQSKWDLAQSITNTAQRRTTIEQQVEMERLGNQILEMRDKSFYDLIKGDPSRFRKARIVEAEVIG